MSNMSYYVKSKLKKIRNGLDEAKFLLSNSYRFFLQKIVNGVTGNYDLKVKFSNAVCTDGKIIYVNPVHPYVMKKKDIAGKTLIILGQLAHETFHIIYTNFETLKEITNRYGQYGDFRVAQVHESMNIIEDAAIELAGTNYYTGSFKQAIIANNQNALDNMPSLDELFQKGAPKLSIFKMACAMYCILGTMKGKLQDPKLINLFKKAMPILDKGRLAPDSWGRLEAAEKLYNLMLPLIKETEKTQQQQQAQDNYQYTKNNQISSGGSGSKAKQQPEAKQDFQKSNKKKTKEEIEKEEQQSKQQKKKKSSSNQQGAGKEEEGSDDEKNDSSSSGENSRDEEKEQKEQENDQDGSGNSGDKVEDEEENKNQEDNSSSSGDNSKDNSEEDENSQSSNASKNNSDGDKSGKGESPNSDDDSEENDETGKKDEENMEEMLKGIEDQLEGVKEDAAKEEYDKQEQLKQDNAIREFSKTVSYSALHRHIRVTVQRNFEVDDGIKFNYQASFKLIKGLTRNLSKNMLDVIRFNEDSKTSGLYDGKINKNQLYRADKKVFFKRKDKSDEANLAVEVLVDQSGSMGGSRIVYARLACMMLYEVCKTLDIPFAVIGHSACYQQNIVIHRHFIDFDSRDINEKYKLAAMTTYDNTREGVSLKYAGEYLKRRPEEDKILIAISDGEPYHPSAIDVYEGEVAQKDTGRVVKELEGEGIKIFGVAIGDGKSEIKNIYTQNYIDIPDIKMLPARLISLIRKNLLK